MLTSKRIDGDYSIVSSSSGTITIGGGGTDPVVIAGDLTVQGTTTTINATDLQIQDKIIGLNVGESGPGVSAPGQSGIEINRGADAAPGNFKAYLIFDENLNPSRWVVNVGEGAADQEIVTIGLGAGSPMFNLVDDTSPNLGGNLDVNAFDITTLVSNGDVTLTVAGSGDIVLTTANTGNIRFDGPAVISGPAPNSTPASGDVALYQATDAGGGTQIHFENDTDTGELVSKSKAMVFGLIF